MADTTTMYYRCYHAAAESHFAASLDMVALVSYNGYSGPLPFLAFFCSTAIKAADDIQPIKASSFLCYSTTRGGQPKQRSMAWRCRRRARYVTVKEEGRSPFVELATAMPAAASPIYFSIAILAFSSFFLHLLLPSFQDVLWNFANHKSRKLLLETDCRIRPFSLLCFGRSSSRSRRLRCHYARHRRAPAMPLKKKKRNKEQKRMVKQSCKEKCERKRRRRDSILIMRKFPRDPCTTIEDEEEYHIEEAAAAAELL